MNKKIIIICISIIVVQMMPLLIAIPFKAYSDIEITSKVESCLASFINNEIEIYNSRKSSGKEVYGGIEKLINDFEDKYKDICVKKVNYETSRFNIYKIFIIILIYVLPSVYISVFLQKRFFTNPNSSYLSMNIHKIKKFFCVSIIFLIAVFGFCLMWDFGIADSVHKISMGKILF